MSANGLIERLNQTLQGMLAKFSQSKKQQWSSFIDTSVYAYNTSRHSSTHFTPFKLMFGRCATLPIDLDVRAVLPAEEATNFLAMQEPDQKQYTEKRAEWLEEAKMIFFVAAQAKQKAAYDKRNAKPHLFQKGQLVLKKDFTQKKRIKRRQTGGKVFGPVHHSKRSYEGEHTNWSLKMANQQFVLQVHTSNHTINPALHPPLISSLHRSWKCRYSISICLHFVDCML